jgi:hypothetical protein
MYCMFLWGGESGTCLSSDLHDWVSQKFQEQMDLQASMYDALTLINDQNFDLRCFDTWSLSIAWPVKYINKNAARCFYKILRLRSKKRVFCHQRARAPGRSVSVYQIRTHSKPQTQSFRPGFNSKAETHTVSAFYVGTKPRDPCGDPILKLVFPTRYFPRCTRFLPVGEWHWARTVVFPGLRCHTTRTRPVPIH